MLGDTDDMASRLQRLLPAGWFGGTTPILNALTQGLGSAFGALWVLLQFVIGQARILTASGNFLDLIAVDYFGTNLARSVDEQDAGFKLRISQELLRPRATRAALVLALTEMTGRTPEVFEPAQPNDTGGYTIGGVGYNSGGGWGSLGLPFQFFVTVFRPSGGGIAAIAGYSSGGVPAYGSLAMETDVTPDSIIQAAIPPLLPTATTAWMRFSD